MNLVVLFVCAYMCLCTCVRACVRAHVCVCVCDYICVPCSEGSVVTDYEVQLTDTASDAEVLTVLANYVNANNDKLGVLTVIVSSS